MRRLYLSTTSVICILVVSILTPSPATPAPRQGQAHPTKSLRIADKDAQVGYPEGWSVARDASGVTLINVPLEKQGTLSAATLDKTAQITFDTEDRRNHAEAVRRLKEIEAEVDAPSTFLGIGGWPGLERRFLAPKPRPVSNQSHAAPLAGGSEEMQLRITIAVAAGNLLVRLDGRLQPDAPQEIADQIKAIGRSLVFSTTGDRVQVDGEINKLRSSPSLRPSPSARPAPQESSAAAPASGEASLLNAATSLTQASPQFSVPVGSGSELSVAASPNAKNIVVGSNSGFSFSTDSGQTWKASAGIGNSDPQIAWGQSGGPNGTFYGANIAKPSTAISVSTNNGQNFAAATNSFTCPGMPPSCGGFPFPDQEQIATDRVNVAAGGDRVYATWRNGGTNYGIVCSANSAVSWSPAPATLTAGDFARITVGPNGNVYVVYQSGGNLMLNSYAACNGNPPPAMTPLAGFPKMVAAGISQACPVPGLDRCPTGSPEMVAVDDTAPNHIYVAYNKNTAGNEDIIVQDSPDGGLTWDTNPANHRIVTVSSAVATRRFLPWVCSAGGAAQVTWYDRRASTPCPTPPCTANNDLTDYFAGSASLDGAGNLAAGTESKVNAPGSTDAQCAAGAMPGSSASWPAGVIASGDSESCNVQPQLAGFCCLPCPQNPMDPCIAAASPCGAGSTRTRCDFDEGPACIAGESCVGLGGAPKYGDYNGNACAAGRLLSVWASATPAEVGPAFGVINTFFSAMLVNGPQIQIPGNVNLADTCVGSSSTATLNVCNTGNKDLQVGPPAISSSNTQFAVTTPTSGYPIDISPNFCFPFQVKFTPISAGAKMSTLTIASNDPANPSVTVQATGNGIQQQIATLMAANGAFGNVCVGSFEDLALTISNTGGCSLSVSGISSSSGEFQLASVMSFPLVIAPGGSTQVPIRFQPTSFGSKSANITVTSNDPFNPTTLVAVTGNAPPPTVKVTGSGAFGNVCGGTLAEKTIQVCDFPTVNSCSLNVTSVALSAGCTDFQLVNSPFPASVSANSCLGVTVAFTPTSAGNKSCNLIITDNDPATPSVTIPLTADTPLNVINIPPDLGFPPTVIESVGLCKTPEPFPISNNGICPLKINNVAITADAREYGFSGLPSLPLFLPPGTVLGNGNLDAVSTPVNLSRNDDGALTVTYESDPITHAVANVTRNLCDEGVKTGARLLVTAGGVPLATVKKIHLVRVTSGQTVDLVQDAPLHTVTPAVAACSPFMFHREWGTVSDPIQLVTGFYKLTVTVVINGKVMTQEVSFNVNTCTFNPNIVVNF